MKKHWYTWVMFSGLITSSVFAGSYASDKDSLPPGHPPVSSSGAMGGSGGGGENGPILAGEIVETMDTGNYTYVLINTGEKSVWAATEKFAAVIGSHVTVPRGMMVRNFESPTLGRTFDELYFADSVEVAGSDSEFVPVADADQDEPEAVENISPVEGGISIASVYQNRAELNGQTVTVRGKVTKYTERVMGLNWIHIADGTSAGDYRDLTISTTDTARKGEVVTITGLVAIDQDLGYGYFYNVLLKDANVTRE